jgi:hypothetical protein
VGNIVSSETGLIATLRRTLAQSAGAIMWSLRMIGVDGGVPRAVGSGVVGRDLDCKTNQTGESLIGSPISERDVNPDPEGTQ